MIAARPQRVLGFREIQVLQLAQHDIETTGQVRSYRNIAAALGMSARHHVADTVRRLERRGLIAREGVGQARRIVIPRGNFADDTHPLAAIANERRRHGRP